VRLEKRELAVVWACVRRHQVSGAVCAARRQEELGLLRVSDREAKRLPRDNRSCTARRHRAAARAKREAATILGGPEVPGAPEVQGGQGVTETVQGGQEVKDTVPEERIGTRNRSSRSELKVKPVILLRGGGTRSYFSPCEWCVNYSSRRPKDYSAAQEPLSQPSRRSYSSRRRPYSSHRRPRSPTRTPSPGPPQL